MRISEESIEKQQEESDLRAESDGQKSAGVRQISARTGEALNGLLDSEMAYAEKVGRAGLGSGEIVDSTGRRIIGLPGCFGVSDLGTVVRLRTRP